MRRAALEYVENKFLRKDLADFRTGDTVRVHWKVKEGDKERVQPFEGIVIRKTKGYNRATFTVRKMSYGVGVERIFPLHSPRYERIEILTRGDVSRNRLFYLRDLKGKASRVDTEEAEQPGDAAPAGPGPVTEKPAEGAPAETASEAKGEEKPKAKAKGKGEGDEAKPKAEKKAEKAPKKAEKPAEKAKKPAKKE